MALEKTITKKSVNKSTDGRVSLVVNLTLKDGGIEVLNQDFSQNHNPANDISSAGNELLKRMQNKINEYKSGKVVYGSALFDKAILDINSKLEV